MYLAVYGREKSELLNLGTCVHNKPDLVRRGMYCVKEKVVGIWIGAEVSEEREKSAFAKEEQYRDEHCLVQKKEKRKKRQLPCPVLPNSTITTSPSHPHSEFPIDASKVPFGADPIRSLCPCRPARLSVSVRTCRNCHPSILGYLHNEMRPTVTASTSTTLHRLRNAYSGRRTSPYRNLPNVYNRQMPKLPRR